MVLISIILTIIMIHRWRKLPKSRYIQIRNTELIKLAKFNFPSKKSELIFSLLPDFNGIFNVFFSVVEAAQEDDSDENEEVREVTKLLSGGIMETQFGELNVFANRDTPTPPVDETGTVYYLVFLLILNVDFPTKNLDF